jgi:sugar/nucleoside kinase (ribokinase family)
MKPTPRYDVLTFSDMCVDLILSGPDVTPQFGQVEKLIDDYTLEMGGSCNIFACQCAKLGLKTAVFGRVGSDSFGRLVLDRLDECGVDTSLVIVDPARKTGIGVALCPPGDRAILTYMGTINAIYPEDITPQVLSLARHIHHGSFYLHTNLLEAVPDIFRSARSLRCTTSLDPNWDPAEEWQANLAQILPHTSIFMPNDQEALRISRQAAPEQAAQFFLDQGVSMVTIKAGANGAAAYAPGNQWQRAAVPVKLGDSIGAGDSFDAGFLAGWLRGMPVDDCLRIAAACGSSVASRVGGLAGQLRWEDVA